MTLWIRTVEELERFVAGLRGTRALALDSESDSLHHHFEKVCLVQIAAESGEARLIDTLCLESLEPLAPVIADPGIVKVFHGADYDVTTMKRDFGFRFARVFDTMIAMRFLGAKEIGLQAALSSELGVAISKKSQRDDWSRRPLTSAQEAYAVSDVSDLLRLHERLVAKLQALGRLGWVEEECAVVADLEPARRRSGDDAYLRVRGAHGLSRRGLAILREVYGWRERLAEETDAPAFKLLSGETLIALAQRPPSSAKDLEGARGVPARLGPRAESLLEAVRRGQAVPQAALPDPPRAARPIVPEEVKARRDALRSWRTQEAERLGLDVSVVLPQRLIERVAEDPPAGPADLARIEGIRHWRLDAFGPAIVSALPR